MVDTEAQGEPVREALTVELAAAEREGDTVKVGLSEALSVADCVYVPDTVPQGVGAGEEVREGDREGEGVKVVVTLAVEDAVKQLDHALIYVYLQQAPRPVLLQQAKYFGPFKSSKQAYLLTGEQHVYGGPIERELIYQCWLSGIKP